MKRIQKGLCRSAALLLAASVLVCAQDSGSTQASTPPKFDPDSVARGKATFISNCAFCHGSNAKGGEKGPDLLRSVLVLDDEHGQSIGKVVLKGRPEKGMPRFSFSPEQIGDLANFLHSSILAAADRDSYKVLNIVTGYAQAGKAYFESKCASCHSVTGDLKGIGAKYEPVTLQDKWLNPSDHWTDSSGKEQFALTVTVTLPSGESFSGTPVVLDDFNVAFKDSQGVYHSYKRSGDIPKVELQNKLQPHLDMLMTYKESDIHNLTAYLVTVK